jgi:hypothetical protein
VTMEQASHKLGRQWPSMIIPKINNLGACLSFDTFTLGAVGDSNALESHGEWPSCSFAVMSPIAPVLGVTVISGNDILFHPGL